MPTRRVTDTEARGDIGDEVDRFLGCAGWTGSLRQPVAADASSRRFFRLQRPDDTAILMIDDGPGGGATGRFASMARWLRGCGYAAPRILAEDVPHGLLLVEDLGDNIAAVSAASGPDREREIYSAAAEFLADLARQTPPGGMDRLDSGGLGRLAELAWEWYAPAAGHAPPDPRRMGAEVAQVTAAFDPDGLVVSLRDFHAENILWCPDRPGLLRLGLVDFQDAVLAHPVYDLVSLLQDARRDVGADAATRAVARYCAATGRDPDAIAGAMAAIGAARALRILGVFARLALRDGKTRYLPMLPRVWGHLAANLRSPALKSLRATVAATLPAPDASVLKRLAAQAGRHPSSAMIFAAGLGTRMRPLTDSLPKPLIPVAGKPLIDHALAATQGCGVDRVVVNLHHLAPMIRRHLSGRDPRVVLSDETDQLLETGGGLKRALPLLGQGPVFTINSDAVWLGPNPLSVLRSRWDPDRMDALLLLVPGSMMIGHHGQGDFAMAPDGRLSRAAGLVYVGAQIIVAGEVGQMGETAFSLNRVWDRLDHAGRLYGTIYPGRVADVGRPDSVALAEAALAAFTDGARMAEGGA